MGDQYPARIPFGNSPYPVRLDISRDKPTDWGGILRGVFGGVATAASPVGALPTFLATRAMQGSGGPMPPAPPVQEAAPSPGKPFDALRSIGQAPSEPREMISLALRDALSRKEGVSLRELGALSGALGQVGARTQPSAKDQIYGDIRLANNMAHEAERAQIEAAIGRGEITREEGIAQARSAAQQWLANNMKSVGNEDALAQLLAEKVAKD